MRAEYHVLFVDNFDSFTYNLVDEFRSIGATVEIWRNDTPTDHLLQRLDEIHPTLLALSPGPGHPDEAGCLPDLIRATCGRIPTLGICLGHQALASSLGGKVGQAPALIHGKPAPVFHDGEGFFAGLPSPFTAGRYHSLIVDTLPPGFRLRAWTFDAGHKIPMAMSHETDPLVGLQFHPESILTPQGRVIIERIMAWAHGFSRDP
ncbi:MAG: aminodeoxychorismate/anthranilate synthase component II [Gammaproteobacteria bacterium]